MRKYSVVLVFLLTLLSAAAYGDPLTATEQVFVIPSPDQTTIQNDVLLPAPELSKLEKEAQFVPVPMDPDAFFKISDKNLPKPVDPYQPPIEPESLASASVSDDSGTVTRIAEFDSGLAESSIPEVKKAGTSANDDPGKAVLTDPDGYEPDDSATDYTYILPTTSLFSQAHTLHTISDDDWFRFSAVAGRTYTFYSTGSLDIRLILYDDAGTTVVSMDDNSGSGNNFFLQYTSATTVYRKMKIESIVGSTGSYSFYYTYGSSADAFEDDNVYTLSTYTEPIYNLTSQIHTISSTTDADWIQIYCYTGRSYHVYTTGDLDTRGYLYLSNGTTLALSDDNSGTGNNFQLNFYVSTNAYHYLKITGTGSNTGFYIYNYNITTNADSYEPDDSAADFSEIYPTTTIQTQNHSIDVPTDEDWFRIYAIEGKIYRLQTTGNTDTFGWLYQDNGTTVVSSDDDSGASNNFLIDFNCTVSGYYKLKISGFGGAIGDYSLDYYYYQTADTYEPDNSTTDYNVITPIYSENIQAHTLHNASDQDWYRFQAVPGRIYNFHSTGATDTQIYLYEDDGVTQLNWDDDDYGIGLNYLLEFATPVTAYYKLKVTGFAGSIGSYMFAFSYGATADAYEPDDTAASSTELTVLHSELTQTHTLHISTDDDWYRIPVYSGRAYTFYTTGNTDTKVYLYQADGTTLISEDDDGAGYPNFYLQYAATSNTTILLKVIGYGGFLGAYELHCSYSTTLTPPFHILLSKTGTNNYSLDWTPVVNATTYRVEYSFRPYSGYVTLGTVATTHASIMIAVQKVFFRVKALN